MDNSILEGVQAPLDSVLPGSLKLQRRAPALYRRLTRGLYPSHTHSSVSKPSGDRSNSTKTTGLESPEKSSKALARSETAGRRTPEKTHGSFYHPVLPSPSRRTAFPAMDHLSVYAIGTYSAPNHGRQTDRLTHPQPSTRPTPAAAAS